MIVSSSAFTAIVAGIEHESREHDAVGALGGESGQNAAGISARDLVPLQTQALTRQLLPGFGLPRQHLLRRRSFKYPLRM